MPASPLDSAVYRELLGDPEIGRLFGDAAEVRAMLLVEGALAKAQGALGIIPQISAAAIHRASLEVQIDPGDLATSTGRNAVPVPGLVAAFRKAMNAPEHAQYIHWGATSQDIADTALVLRLRQALAIIEDRLDETLRPLADLARAHAATPIIGRTYGQAAVPTSFGAMAAGWGAPVLASLDALGDLRGHCLAVSLSGAAGTLSAMGTEGPEVRSKLAEALGLGDPGRGWHSDRARLAAIAGWLTGLSVSLGKMGEDLILAAQTGIGEIRIGGAGGSSTMPQKENPVAPSVLVALARTAAGLNAILQGAGLHRQARDGAAWITEWLTLPQLCLVAGRAALTARDLASAIEPDPDTMCRNIDASGGAMFAEALSFALAGRMPRDQAQAEAGRLIAEARASGRSLAAVAQVAHSGLSADLFDAACQLGTAPAEALAFADAVGARAAAG